MFMTLSSSVGAAAEQHNLHVKDFEIDRELALKLSTICISDLANLLGSQPPAKRSDAVRLALALSRRGIEVTFDDYLKQFEPDPDIVARGSKSSTKSSKRGFAPPNGLAELCRYPLLNAENERLICIACEIAQVRYRRELFSNIAMVEAAVDRISRIYLKKGHENRLKYTDVLVGYKSGELSVKSLGPQIPSLLKQLQELIKQYREAAETTAELKQGILVQIFDILEQMPIKTENFAKDICKKIVQDVQESVNAGNPGAAAQTLKTSYAMSCDELKSYLERVAAREGDLNKVLAVLCQANMRMVIQIARRLSSNSMTLTDLVSEGYFCMRLAAIRFDYTLGYRFSTFAVPYVRGLLQASLPNEESIISLPPDMRGKFHQLQRRVAQCMQAKGGALNSDEIEQVAQSDYSLATNLLLQVFRATTPSADIDAEVLLDSNSPTDEGADTIPNTLADTIPGDDGRVNEDRLNNLSALANALQFLTDRQVEVIRRYYGIDYERPMTFRQIVEVIGTTTANVGQHYQRALKQLKEALVIPAEQPPVNDKSHTSS